MDTAITRLAEDKVRAGQSGLKLIADNGEALAVRALAARSAVSTLDLMYYIWRDDHTGRLLIREVVDAADRGVRVRMLIDDINPQASDALYLSLNSHPNIELRLFNPSAMRNGSPFRYLELVSRMFAMTRRMHTKAWIADGSVAIVGGRNIGDAYFDAADTNFRDLDLLLLGPAVNQTAAIFETYWRCKVARPVHLLHPKGTRKAPPAADGLAGDSKMLAAIGNRHSIGEFAATSELHWTSSARVIADPPEKVSGKGRRSWLMRELLPIISGARKDLQIVSPYFIPGRKGMSVLKGLIDGGVDVSVLTNSLAATDVAAVHGAYANYRPRLLRSGVKLFELQPFAGKRKISVFGSKGASLHTKAFSVDGRIGFVGSFNFDPRSLSLNAEMGVVFEDEALVAELARRFRRERSPETSYRLYLDKARLRWEGADDDGITQFAHEPEASLARRIVARVVGYLPVESQL